MRLIMGNDKEGLVARGSWCGMNLIDGICSFFSTGAGAVVSAEITSEEAAGVVGARRDSGSPTVAARLLVMIAACWGSVEVDESVAVG